MHFDQQLYTLVKAAIKEDVGDGDHSSLSCIPADARGKAILKLSKMEFLRELQLRRKFFASWNQQAFL
jgi:nicotinate-nucleotide pyrophosphorylase (carboxylating)